MERQWTKLDISSGRNGRTKFATYRDARDFNCCLVVPGQHALPADRFDVLTDGNGAVAFKLSSDGMMKVTPPTQKKLCPRLRIPNAIRDMVPFGTHDADVEVDGDMLILDLVAHAENCKGKAK